jgi:hypothetical protein
MMNKKFNNIDPSFIGQEAFDQGIMTYLNKYQYSNAAKVRPNQGILTEEEDSVPVTS